MKKSLFSQPDTFSISPLLALLPVMGNLQKLDQLSASLYARYEKVAALKKNVDSNDLAYKNFIAEQEMLKQVLDYLNIKPEQD